jgi:hypothetical protein
MRWAAKWEKQSELHLLISIKSLSLSAYVYAFCAILLILVVFISVVEDFLLKCRDMDEEGYLNIRYHAGP